MKSAQMTMASHTAVALSEAEMEGDILLLTMDEEQKIKLTEQYGDNGNIYTLKEFTGEETDIPNPYGKPMWVQKNSGRLSARSQV